MLDRKVKDVDASVELLEDRKEFSRHAFLISFIIGWIIVLVAIVFVPYKYDEICIGCGIAILIFATWFLINWWGYDILIKISHMKEK